MPYYPDDHPAFDMPDFNPQPDDEPERTEMRHIRAEAVRFEGDEDGWHMFIDTADELIDVHVHVCAWELAENCDRTIGAERRTALTIKREVERTLDNDSGYDRDDPKHPAYHSTHVAIWDEREKGK